MKPFLKPRLNYSFRLKDLFLSIRTILFNYKKNPEELNSLFQDSHLFFTNHARTGLRLLLNSLDLKPNSRIGVKAYNCHTVFNAIHQSGHIPVFIDVDEHLQFDLLDLEDKILGIECLIITHTFGFPENMVELAKITSHIPTIEDCAHSFLSQSDHQLTGTFSDAAIFSFGHAKFPAIASGGLVVLNNNKYLNNLTKHYQLLPKNSILDEIKELISSIILKFLHFKPVYGIFTKPFLKKEKSINAEMIKFTEKESVCLQINKNRYLSLFNHFPQFLIQQKNNAQLIHSKTYVPKNTLPNYFMIPFIVENRNEIIDLFYHSNIEIGKHFSQSIEWAQIFGYETASCPKTESYVSKIIAIPCHYNYSKRDLHKIAQILKNENIN